MLLALSTLHNKGKWPQHQNQLISRHTQSRTDLPCTTPETVPAPPLVYGHTVLYVPVPSVRPSSRRSFTCWLQLEFINKVRTRPDINPNILHVYTIAFAFYVFSDHTVHKPNRTVPECNSSKWSKWPTPERGTQRSHESINWGLNVLGCGYGSPSVSTPLFGWWTVVTLCSVCCWYAIQIWHRDIAVEAIFKHCAIKNIRSTAVPWLQIDSSERLEED